MRTTVTLDPDTEAIVRQRMTERGQTFKQAINGAIRAGVRPRSRTKNVSFKTYDMGEPRIDVTKALQVAAELEDHQMSASMGHEEEEIPRDEDS